MTFQIKSHHVDDREFGAPLPLDTKKGMVFHAERDRQIEVCGFVMDIPDFGITAVQCRNVAKDQAHYWDVHPEDLELVYANEDWLIGVYHSHPTGPAHPSSADYKYAPPGLRYFIVCDGKVHEYDMENREEIK